MKHVILIIISFLFICNSHAQNERAATEAVGDLVGTLTASERIIVNQLIQEVKNKKNWDVQLFTSSTSSPQVFLNALYSVAVGSKKILIVIPENLKNTSAEIHISKDLESVIFPDKIDYIKKTGYYAKNLNWEKF